MAWWLHGGVSRARTTMSQPSATAPSSVLEPAFVSISRVPVNRPPETGSVTQFPGLPARRLEGSSQGFLVGKRVIDVLVALVLIGAFSPIILALTVLIPLCDGGPPFYSQQRVGRRGRTFRFVKFRSMRVNSDALRDEVVRAAGQENLVRFKQRDDPRITGIGRLLRRSSLDELPQLFSVLKGDMSLVGPRPALPSEVEAYDHRARRRLEVTPGLTCSWQVSGRSELSFDEQIDLDLDYIERRSLGYDLMLLLRTPGAVLTGRGAY